MLNNGKAAAAEFQRFVNRGLVANFPWGALVRLGAARDYGLEAATDAVRERARTAYQNFLTSKRMPTPTFPSTCKPKPSTRSCGSLTSHLRMQPSCASQ